MKRYEGDLKAKALARMNEVGVKKTGEELGISIQTLYKWRNEDQPAAPLGKKAADGKLDTLVQIIKNDGSLEAKIQRLEAENAELRKTLAQMRKAFVAMFE